MGCSTFRKERFGGARELPVSSEANRTSPVDLRLLVAEAAQSLSRLDVNRLEELALSCEALNNDRSPETQRALMKQAETAKRDMDLLAKVLEATRANAAVMARLRKLHEDRLEYSAEQAVRNDEPEAAHGHD